jgi:hypothetical protein
MASRIGAKVLSGKYASNSVPGETRGIAISWHILRCLRADVYLELCTVSNHNEGIRLASPHRPIRYLCIYAVCTYTFLWLSVA